MHRIAISTLLFLSLCVSVQASEYLVLPDGTGDFVTIQDAISGTVDGDVILLGDGTFTGPGNVSVNFGGKAVTVRSQSGNQLACIIDCEGSETIPASGFIFENGEMTNSQVMDLTIANGYSINGGAIHMLESGPWLKNILFNMNRANDGGGAIYCFGGSPVITECVFVNNGAMGFVGGGISCTDSEITIASCQFTANYTVNRGGAIYATGTSELEISNCDFEFNTAAIHGGAIYLNGLAESGNYTILSNCSFIDNSCAEDGGAVVSIWTLATMDYCTFKDNSADHGNAIWSGGNTAVLEMNNCTFAQNTGGESVFRCNADSDQTLNNCIVAFNTGASFEIDSGSVVHFNCTDIFGNGEDWTDQIDNQLGMNGNIWLDPQFCDPDLTITETSPCAPFSSPNDDCDLIGAWPVGCEGTSPVAPTNWGGLKSLYR